MLINPAREVVEEVCGSSVATANRSFPIGTVQSSPRLQLMTQSLRGRLAANEDALGNDELTIQMMRAAMQGTPVRGRPSARTVDRAKEFLHAHDGSRLSLEEVSSAVGVSPVYLTQEFTRSEGVPLYRYYLSLRLARALTELPHSDDITGLALDLGFSCHSHFTLAFRKAFGMTPSQYRRSAMRPNVIRSPLNAAGPALRAA